MAQENVLPLHPAVAARRTLNEEDYSLALTAIGMPLTIGFYVITGPTTIPAFLGST